MAIVPKPIPTRKECPRCLRVRAAKFFDTRYCSGYEYLQSWCRDCRNDGKRKPIQAAKQKIQVNENLFATRRMFKSMFPEKQAILSWGNMVEFLIRTMGEDQIELSPSAAKKWEVFVKNG